MMHESSVLCDHSRQGIRWSISRWFSARLQIASRIVRLGLHLLDNLVDIFTSESGLQTLTVSAPKPPPVP